MKKITLLLASLFLLTSCGSSPFDNVNKYGINTENNHFSYDGNFVKPELTIDGKDLEDEWRGDRVSDVLNMKNPNGSETSLKIYRGKEAFFFYFNVTDKYICSKGTSNGDDVSYSDSIEIYIDSLNDGGTRPQVDDYQINLGVHDRTRILVGTGRYWTNWNGLCQYEANINGTLNNNSDIDIGYSIEVMLPYNQINCSRDSIIGIGFGNVDKVTLEDSEIIAWTGLVFDGMNVEPQSPDNYVTYRGNTFYSRGLYNGDVTFSGVISDEANKPLENVNVTLGNKTAITDAYGKYNISGINPKNNLEVSFAKDGYKTFKDTYYSSNMLLSEGDIEYSKKLVVGSGEVKPTYAMTTIGNTIEKSISGKKLESTVLSGSRSNEEGLYFEFKNNGLAFDDYQQYELYLDFGDTSRGGPDAETWCFTFTHNGLSFISSNPKDDNPKYYCFSAVNFNIDGNSAFLYIPYKFLDVTSDDVVAIAFGLFDSQVSDWCPLARMGQEIVVENLSTYFKMDKDGKIINGPKGADEYIESSDTHTYVGLGEFGGKTTKGITFSKPKVKVDRTNSEHIALLFETDQNNWRFDEKIEIFIDGGLSSRTIRDDKSFLLVVGTGYGNIISFKKYTNPETSLDYSSVKVAMNNKKIQVIIPNTLLSITSDTLAGFSFGLFNTTADDWDGYGYNETYIDPEKPNLYVRVDKNNAII